MALSRITSRISSFWPADLASWMTASAHFCMPAWTSPLRSSFPGKALRGALVNCGVVAGILCVSAHHRTCRRRRQSHYKPSAQHSTPRCEECQHEPTVPSVAVGVLVDYEGMEASPSHPTATEREYQLNLMDSLSVCVER